MKEALLEGKLLRDKDLLGTIVSTNDSPSLKKIDFILENFDSNIPIQLGEFVFSIVNEHKMIFRVTNIRKVNRYYQHFEAVKEYQSHGSALNNVFPTDKWEYALVEAVPLGIIQKDNIISKPTFPPSPGDKIWKITPELLFQFIGLNKNGLNLGYISSHNIPLLIDLDRLLGKHLAVLAMSGFGKSYFISVLIEELLNRTKEDGQLSVIVLDVHGEYTYFAESKYKEHVFLIPGHYIEIPTADLNSYDFASLIPQMSPIQLRELSKLLYSKRKEKINYSLSDLIEEITNSDISRPTKDALVGWLSQLEHYNLFGKSPNPELKSIMKPGNLTIIDLSSLLSLKKKQIIAYWLATRLLELRRRNLIAPFLLILEEAHQFCPESSQESAISKSAIETIAREGRKFFALLGLVSQRPVRLSTTVLSQCNSQVILRVTNPYDLKHIGETSEGIDKSALDSITTLDVGEALIIGESVRLPTFAKIRNRTIKPSGKINSLTEAAKHYISSE